MSYFFIIRLIKNVTLLQIDISVKDFKYRGILSSNNIKSQKVSQLANCIRFLAIDAVQKANSGHPGMPMGMADIATVLYKKHLKFDPADPKWIDRDRLILSNGHGSMLLYACLYLTGYKDINLEDIKNFRQLKSPTAGHPEYGELEGIETTTGPLSQGLSNGIGFAIAEKKLSSTLGEDTINHHTYIFAGDGCLMEGLSHEACSLAGHLRLNKLIVFFDDNSISIDGPVSLSSSDDISLRFKSYNWNVLKIDGHNHDEIDDAIVQAKTSDKPTLICCKTKIGFGSPNKESKSSSHGSPLGEEEIQYTRKNLNWDHGEFIIPEDLFSEWRDFGSRNAVSKKNWQDKNKHFLNSDEFKKFFSTKLDPKTKNEIIEFKTLYSNDETKYATRKASEKALEVLNKHIKNFIGGSADLTGSNNTKTSEMNIFNSDTTPSIMKPVTPDPSKNSFTKKLSGTVSKSQSKTPLKSALSGVESIGETFSPTKVASVVPDGGSNIIKVLLIVSMVVFLAYNLYLFYYEKTDIFKKFFGITLFKSKQGTKNLVKNTEIGAKQVIDIEKKAQKNIGHSIAEIGKSIENQSKLKRAIEKPKKKESKVVEDDSTESNIQQKKSAGYCYIGSDRGYRSCVKLTDKDTCASNKIFPSMEICVNPELRK